MTRPERKEATTINLTCWMHYWPLTILCGAASRPSQKLHGDDNYSNDRKTEGRAEGIRSVSITFGASAAHSSPSKP